MPAKKLSLDGWKSSTSKTNKQTSKQTSNGAYQPFVWECLHIGWVVQWPKAGTAAFFPVKRLSRHTTRIGNACPLRWQTQWPRMMQHHTHKSTTTIYICICMIHRHSNHLKVSSPWAQPTQLVATLDTTNYSAFGIYHPMGCCWWQFGGCWCLQEAYSPRTCSPITSYHITPHHTIRHHTDGWVDWHRTWHCVIS